MGSFDSLRIGASGIYVSGRAVEIASQNVANASTPGYTRQRLDIVNAPPSPGVPGVRGDGMRGTGAALAGIDRLRDDLADVAWRTQADIAGDTFARSDVLRRVEQMVGDIGTGIPSALDAFWSSWNQLSITPTDPGARAAVLSAGAGLARDFNELAANIDSVIPDLARRLFDQTAEVNQLSAHIAKLNAKIVDAVVTDQTPSDLMDERDRAIDRLATLTGAYTRNGEYGSVDVFIAGEALVRGKDIQQLKVALSPVGVPSVTFTDDRPAVIRGEMGGYLQSAQVTLPGLRTELDAITVAIRDLVNPAHQAGFDLSGAAGLDFFVGTDALTFAVNAAVGPSQVAASASGALADGNNALAMSKLRTAAASGPATSGDLVRGFLGKVGMMSADASRSSSAATAVLEGAVRRRDESHGVSVDEEMVDLLRFQRAYQAAARVVTTADELLDTLINRMAV